MEGEENPTPTEATVIEESAPPTAVEESAKVDPEPQPEVEAEKPTPVPEPVPEIAVPEPVAAPVEVKVEPPAPEPVAAPVVETPKAEPVVIVKEAGPACTSCGSDVTNMKFCGSCGTKVMPSECLVCSAHLVAKAKFCPECGTPRGLSERPAPPVVATEKPVSAQVEVRPRVESARPRVDSSQDVVREAQSALKEAPSTPVPASPPRDPTAAVKVEGEVSAEKKKFSVKQSPKCAVCAKSVYETEKSLDSVGTIYHKECFRCKTCKVYLNGRQRIVEPEFGSQKLTTGQYMVAKEGSQLGEKGTFFCDKHTIKARASVVKSKAIDEKAKDEGELQRVASMRKDQNEEARNSMQIRVGDMLPTCARCGQPIDKGQKAMTTGIQKMHESCPTKEEAEKAVRTTRFFVRKAPDRLAGTLTCDKETKHPHTFLYEIDKNTLMESLKKNGSDDLLVRYLPDAQARTAGSRKLVAPSSDAAREFDINFKDFYTFSYKNPKNNDAVQTPVVDKKEKLLKIKKFHHANGVLQTLEAVFTYDEATRLCAAEKIEIAFEMWPPEAATEMQSQLDPLAHLRHNKGETRVEEQLIPDAPTKAAPSEPGSNDAPAATAASAGSEAGPGNAAATSSSTGKKRKESVKKDCVVM